MQLMKNYIQKKKLFYLYCVNDEEKVIRPIQLELEAICEYFGWNIKGRIFALGCGEVEDIKASKHLEASYNLGKSI